MKRASRFTRLFALTLSVILLAGLSSACGGGSAPASPEPAPVASAPVSEPAPASTPAASQPEAAPPAADEKVVIQYGGHVANFEAQEPAPYAIFQKFMADNPNITIEVSQADVDEHEKRMKMAAESGMLPDVVWLQPAPALEMWEAGYLMDLNEFFAADAGLNSIMGDMLRETSPVDNAVIGLPYQKLVTGFWYNKKLFAENNITEPVQGTTFEEMLDIVGKFKDAGIIPITQGAKSPHTIWAFLQAWGRYGFFEHFDGIVAGTDSFVNDDFIRFFEKIQMLHQAGAFPENTSVMNFTQAKELFAGGQSAFLDSGAWDAATVDGALGDDVGFWWGPVFADGVGDQKLNMQAYTNNIRVNAAVADDPAKKAAVFKLLSFFYSPEADQIRVDLGVVPLAHLGDTSNVPTAFAVMQDAMGAAGWKPLPDQPDQVVSSAVQVVMYDAIYGTIMGNYTPEKALQLIEDAMARER